MGDEGSYALKTTTITAGSGLTGGGALSSNVTIGHSNTVAAQSTQALYPISIDAQGHISGYGTAVTPLTATSTLDASKLSGTIPSTVVISGKEDTSNKVTSITSESTNTQYPSAYAVYNIIKDNELITALALNDLNTRLLNSESTSNKVTYIDANSTDTQYPSAKCMYDEITYIKENIFGIEALLVQI